MANSNPTPENTQKRRYRILILIEGLLLGLTVMGFVAVGYGRVGHWIIWPLTLVVIWHVVVIPICVMYLIGNPVVMSLSPLIPSAESTAFRMRLSERPAVGDAEFYGFFAESGIPGEIVARLRRCLLKLDPLIERATPDDNLCLLDDELDFACLLHLVEREFGIKFAEKTDYKTIDGTLGNLLRLTYSKIQDSVR